MLNIAFKKQVGKAINNMDMGIPIKRQINTASLFFCLALLIFPLL